jgi:DNA gyrase subunit B
VHVESDEDEVEKRTYVVFEDKNGHRTRLGVEVFNSKVYKQAFETRSKLQNVCGDLEFTLRSKSGEEENIRGLTALLDNVLEHAHKGISIQRYKGLGEMNPEQLWETTMNPDKRTMLQVNIQDAAEANDIFTDLMGDNVEPRRLFIERNALSVQELDI